MMQDEFGFTFSDCSVTCCNESLCNLPRIPTTTPPPTTTTLPRVVGKQMIIDINCMFYLNDLLFALLFQRFQRFNLNYNIIISNQGRKFCCAGKDYIMAQPFPNFNLTIKLNYLKYGNFNHAILSL